MSEIRDIEWVMRRKNRRHGLEPIKAALHEISDPQDTLRTVHIAGTNGKGSTVNYLCALLEAAGYTTGTFTSPHLVHHCDRIRINGKWIPEETFLNYLREDMPLIEKYDLGMFEIDTLISLQWFRDMKADIILMETGLGGRLDNTNVFRHPELNIITTIAYDHTDILGERIQQIAFEKAGIIMPGSRCVCGRLNQHAMNVIRLAASRRHARLSTVRPYRSLAGNRFAYRDQTYEIQGAQYQKNNAALALEAAYLLGVDIKSEASVNAIKNACWAGRYETVKEHPHVILDGAHNEEGMKALCETLKHAERPVTAVFSALADKPERKMAKMLLRSSDHLILTHFANARADAEALRMDGAVTIGSWKDAVDEALQTEEGTVVITGSLYFISLVREYLLKDDRNEAESR